MKTLFIAHRGYAKKERENTVPAFRNAANDNYAYGIETDVHQTADGVLIISHDANVTRVSGGMDNTNLEEASYDVVSKIRLPGLDGIVRDDLYIPRLYEYIDICKAGKKKAVCELKQLFSLEKIEEIVNLFKEKQMLDDVIFISFIKENIVNVRKINKSLKIQLLLDKWSKEEIAFLLENRFDLDINFHSVDEKLVNLCHQHNIIVNCWTVNNKEDALRLANMGVDMITSDCLNAMILEEE